MISAPVRGASLLYEVGGLAVRSPFAVRHLRLSAGEAGSRVDIAISLDDSTEPSPEQRIFQWPGRYGLCLWRTQDSWQFTSFQDGSFLVSDDGSRIRCYRADARRPSRLRVARTRAPSVSPGMQHVLARRVLPRAGMLHGRIGLHAASVSDGQRAMLILGTTHAGKSTLSAALHQHLGWQVLADDISLIEAGDHSVCCFRVGTGTCLRADTLAGLQISATDSQPIPHQTKKRWCAADTESGPAAAVRAIIFLTQEGQDRIELSRLSPSRALIQATDRQVLFNPADRSARGGLMKALARVVETVPAYDFSYRRGFDYLPAVAAHLRECLDQSVA